MAKVELANEAGFCFGVKRAVDIALNAEKEFNKKIYTLGPLIHNNDIIQYLKNKNIFPIKLEEIDKLKKNDVIIIRSHGVALNTLNKLKEKQLKIINTTCPYVTSIHEKVHKYSNDNYKIFIVGDKNHPEVIGTNGWCNNNAIISKDGSDVDFNSIPKKICIVAQTTEKQANWEKVLNKLIKHCREIIAFNTICSATEMRQKSANELSKKVDAMVVLGGYNSSNTRKLYEICKENCKETIHIENSKEIPKEIYLNNNKVGVTAGASTPDWIIKEAILKMNNEDFIQNEQLEYMENNEVNVYVGKIVMGEIISVTNKEIFLNIGYKNDGIIPKNEISIKEDESLSDFYKVGDFIKAKIIQRQNEEGFVVLSLLELEREKAFEELEKVYNDNKVINVHVKKVVNSGVIASYKGLRIFIPASHLQLKHVENLNQYLNETFDINIIEYKNSSKQTKIIGSRRNLLKEEEREKEEKVLSSIEKGDTIKGIVKRITNFGAFVDVGGIDGLLHISQLSWTKVNNVEDVVHIGDTIEVYVLDIDKENKKVSLSLKELKEKPWDNVDKKYPIGNIVLGKVVRFTDFGAFIELEPGVDGLVHISEISYNKIDKPSDVLKIGENIKSKIIYVDKEKQRISLSIKQVENN